MLPADVASCLEFSTLTLAPNGLIDETLRAQ